MARIATYEYLNTLSSDDKPYNSSLPNALKQCVNPYNFAMEQNYNGYFSDLEYTGPAAGSPPWSLATRDEFQVKSQTPYYNLKLTLQSSLTGYLTGSILRTTSVWNAKPSSYSGDNISVSTSLSSFATPAVSLVGGYSGATSAQSPATNSTSSLSAFTNGTFYDLNGTGNGTSYNPGTGYGPTKVLDSTSTSNATTYVNVTSSGGVTVYVAFLYEVNSSYYIIWSSGIISLVTTYK